jgi:hypothetical protein
MSTLQTIQKKARKAYKEADETVRTLLCQIFDKETLTLKITGLVKTFEDACELTGENPSDEKFCTGTPDEIAYKKLKVIVKALNEDWIADYSNGNQKKWFPYFTCTSSGFRFYDAYYDYAITGTTGGSRLSLASEELVRHIASTFPELYNHLLN